MKIWRKQDLTEGENRGSEGEREGGEKNQKLKKVKNKKTKTKGKGNLETNILGVF